MNLTLRFETLAISKKSLSFVMSSSFLLIHMDAIRISGIDF